MESIRGVYEDREREKRRRQWKGEEEVEQGEKGRRRRNGEEKETEKGRREGEEAILTARWVLQIIPSYGHPPSPTQPPPPRIQGRPSIRAQNLGNPAEETR